MKKLFVLSSWSRIAAIGSIFMVLFLAACGDDDSWSPSDADNSRSSSVILSDDSHEGSSGSRSSDGKGNSSSTNKDESSSSSVILSSGEGSSDNKDNSSSEGSLAESSSSSAGKAKSSSSSVTLATRCKTETEDNCEYGTLLDERDGQTYKTVKIGEQIWMAQNLNLETENSGCGGGSGTTEGNCETYGRLYSWAAAMGKSEEQCGYGHECDLASAGSATFIRGVCPDGWHVPTRDEWNALFVSVGGKSNAGKVLKSQTDWYNGGNGSDAYGFAARPAGSYGDGRFSGEGNHADFWSSTENGSYGAYDMYLTYARVSAHLYTNDKDYGYSVRCVKD